MSTTVCEEIIPIISSKVLVVVVRRVKASKYYSISVDSSGDHNHIDQLTVILRYLEAAKPVERYLTFLESTGHKGEEMTNAMLKFFDSIGLDINDRRGQSYDNASNMSDQ